MVPGSGQARTGEVTAGSEEIASHSPVRLRRTDEWTQGSLFPYTIRPDRNAFPLTHRSQ